MNVDQLIATALDEDLGTPHCDATTSVLFPDETRMGEAHIISKDPRTMTFCGQALVSKIAADCVVNFYHQDGDRVATGDRIVTITGKQSQLLKIERVLLNFLRHLSGVASLTAQFVEKTQHTDMKILDTRKTTPGWRQLEKYAVHCGGGVNHRMGLYDAIMVKDTHIDMLGGFESFLVKMPELMAQSLSVIIEIGSLNELTRLLENGVLPNRVLLDNMSLADMTTAVSWCQNKVETEASGNISLETVTAIATTGVDFASIGMLTHSAGNADLSMKV